MGESTNISDVSGSLLEWNAKHGLKRVSLGLGYIRI